MRRRAGVPVGATLATGRAAVGAKPANRRLLACPVPPAAAQHRKKSRRVSARGRGHTPRGRSAIDVVGVLKSSSGPNVRFCSVATRDPSWRLATGASNTKARFKQRQVWSPDRQKISPTTDVVDGAMTPRWGGSSRRGRIGAPLRREKEDGKERPPSGTGGRIPAVRPRARKGGTEDDGPKAGARARSEAGGQR